MIARRLRTLFARIVDPGAYPYERRVVLWGKSLDHSISSTAVFLWAGFAAFGWPAWWPGFRPIDLMTWGGGWGVLGFLWIAWGTWGASAAASWVWADLGLEERWLEWWLGASIVPNIVPTCKWEDYTGYEPGRYVDAEALEVAWNDEKFRTAAVWQGPPPQGRFDRVAPEAETWAMRRHHRWIRPWAMAPKGRLAQWVFGLSKTGWRVS